MELCAEGTLESLVEVSGSLHEGLTRRFTAQLLTAVNVLHKHGVVHRDIKTANIFLTNGGNSLKLGDFGSAVKIQAHTTVPGELKGYVGTQAYMAPEVFTKTNTDGHGRAADIWSAGCVTIEMASGKVISDRTAIVFIRLKCMFYGYRDLGPNSTRTFRSCSRWGWVKRPKFRLLYPPRVMIFWIIVWNMIRLNGGQLLDYLITISAR